MNTQTTAIKRPADRDEWLRARRGFVGGSEVASLLGLSPWRTAVDLYLDKTGRAPEADEPTEAMRLGNYLEAYAAQRYADETGRPVVNYGYMLTRGHALADIDRLVIPEGKLVAAHHSEIRTDTLVECKTSGAEWGEEPPEYYQAQGQFYLALSGCRFCDFAVVFLAPRRDFRIYRMEADPAVGDALLARVEAFWRDSVEADTPPASTCLADVRALYPTAKVDTQKKASPEVARAVERLRAIKAQTDELDAEAEGLRGAVAAFMGDADTLLVGDKRAVTFRQAKPTERIDYHAALVDIGAEFHLDPARVGQIVHAHGKVVDGARRFLLCNAK